MFATENSLSLDTSHVQQDLTCTTTTFDILEVQCQTSKTQQLVLINKKGNTLLESWTKFSLLSY